MSEIKSKDNKIKLDILVQTPKGYYAGRSKSVLDLKEGLASAMKMLDELPDEIENEAFTDWTKISLYFERKT